MVSYYVCGAFMYTIYVSYMYVSRTHPHPTHTTQYTAHINFLYNCFLRIHVQPEDGYCWKAETGSCTLDSNVNTPLLSNKQVVLD